MPKIYFYNKTIAKKVIDKLTEINVTEPVKSSGAESSSSSFWPFFKKSEAVQTVHPKRIMDNNIKERVEQLAYDRNTLIDFIKTGWVGEAEKAKILAGEDIVKIQKQITEHFHEEMQEREKQQSTKTTGNHVLSEDEKNTLINKVYELQGQQKNKIEQERPYFIEFTDEDMERISRAGYEDLNSFLNQPGLMPENDKPTVLVTFPAEKSEAVESVLNLIGNPVIDKSDSATYKVMLSPNQVHAIHSGKSTGIDAIYDFLTFEEASPSRGLHK